MPHCSITPPFGPAGVLNRGQPAEDNGPVAWDNHQIPGNSPLSDMAEILLLEQACV